MHQNDENANYENKFCNQANLDFIKATRFCALQSGKALKIISNNQVERCKLPVAIRQKM